MHLVLAALSPSSEVPPFLLNLKKSRTPAISAKLFNAHKNNCKMSTREQGNVHHFCHLDAPYYRRIHVVRQHGISIQYHPVCFLSTFPDWFPVASCSEALFWNVVCLLQSIVLNQNSTVWEWTAQVSDLGHSGTGKGENTHKHTKSYISVSFKLTHDTVGHIFGKLNLDHGAVDDTIISLWEALMAQTCYRAWNRMTHTVFIDHETPLSSQRSILSRAVVLCVAQTHQTFLRGKNSNDFLLMCEKR